MLPPLYRIAKAVVFAAWMVFSSSVLLFLVFDLYPPLVRQAGLDTRIRYYELAERYRTNPKLVLEPRTLQRAGTYSWQGDLYSPAFGIEVPRVEHRTSYSERGFRVNSSAGPFDVMLVGDSFIETGETDDSTLSELLKQASGLSTYNAGRSWYGPDQYLEVFRELAPVVKPRIAMFCFFAGNDAEDTVMFERWRRGGAYYDFFARDLGIVDRYLRATHDTIAYTARFALTFAQTLIERQRARQHQTPTPQKPAPQPPSSPQGPTQQPQSPQPPALAATSTGNASSGLASSPTHPNVHPQLALVQLRDEAVAMRLRYIDEPATADELLRRQEWEHLESVLSDFAATAARYGIRPVVLFIPTALETYADQIRDDSGASFLAQFKAQHGYETAQHDALARIAAGLHLDFIDLLPEFRRRAARGELLYYPFDTHWMPSARRAAADVMSTPLLAMLAQPGPATRAGP